MAAEQDWTPWNGGECPVPPPVVHVIYRNGDQFLGSVEAFDWSHEGDDDDIIAYRIVEQKP